VNRRQFLAAGAAAGAGFALGKAGRALAASGQPDLAAARGGEPEAMFDRGIEALGGMKRFVRKGQKVVVRPNIAFVVGLERAASTNPRLVRRVVEQCYAAGASVVHVFDHSAENWERAYELSGIEEAARTAGAKVAPAHTEGHYHEVALPKGVSLRTDKVHELLLESDVLINVPVLKHHGSTQRTIGMRNLMGVVWNRQRWHANDLEQCIADFAGWRKPDLPGRGPVRGHREAQGLRCLRRALPDPGSTHGALAGGIPVPALRDELCIGCAACQ
jgi:uncharacterized protein (DUF362 family)